MKFHSSINHNSPQMEMSYMPISWLMDKQNVLYSCNWIFSGSKKEWNSDMYPDTDEPSGG